MPGRWLSAGLLCVLISGAVSCGRFGGVPSATVGSGASPATGTQLTCGSGDYAFPLQALDLPAGAENQDGPLYDALRATLEEFSEYGSQASTWILATEHDDAALFLGRSATNETGWVMVRLERRGGSWSFDSIGACRPSVVLAADLGTAEWQLDSDYPEPEEGATTLHLLVWERACAGGQPATGRVADPVIQLTSATVTITFGVHPLPGFRECPSNPPTPYTVELSEPLGGRDLLDGGTVPAAPRTYPGQAP